MSEVLLLRVLINRRSHMSLKLIMNLLLIRRHPGSVLQVEVLTLIYVICLDERGVFRRSLPPLIHISTNTILRRVMLETLIKRNDRRQILDRIRVLM